MNIQLHSSTIEFDCPQCGQHIEGPEELFGTLVSCPTCAEKFFATSKPNFASKPSAPDPAFIQKINRLSAGDPEKINEGFLPNDFDFVRFIGWASIGIGLLCAVFFVLSIVGGAAFLAAFYGAVGFIPIGVMLCLWREIIRIRQAVEKLADKPVVK